MNTLHIVVFLAVIVCLQCSEICHKSQGIEWKPDPSDCNKYYLCFGNFPHKYSCPGNTVFSEALSKHTAKCVKQWSKDDKCTPFTIWGRCKLANSFFLQDSSSCSNYIDCSSYTVEQCYYPFLYDENTKRCSPPEIAECGARPVPKDLCDYMPREADCRNSSQCVPCADRFPSCDGLQDGLNVWKGREWSPYFVVCKNERLLYQDECKNQIFHPKKRTCLSF